MNDRRQTICGDFFYRRKLYKITIKITNKSNALCAGKQAVSRTQYVYVSSRADLEYFAKIVVSNRFRFLFLTFVGGKTKRMIWTKSKWRSQEKEFHLFISIFNFYLIFCIDLHCLAMYADKIWVTFWNLKINFNAI